MYLVICKSYSGDTYYFKSNKSIISREEFRNFVFDNLIEESDLAYEPELSRDEAAITVEIKDVINLDVLNELKVIC
jgi:hypothetical protein